MEVIVILSFRACVCRCVCVIYREGRLVGFPWVGRGRGRNGPEKERSSLTPRRAAHKPPAAPRKKKKKGVSTLSVKVGILCGLGLGLG